MWHTMVRLLTMQSEQVMYTDQEELQLLTVGVREQCDLCSARAQFGVFLQNGPLTFCAHHYNDHADALTKSGAVVKMILH
jgi:hypothetical protein